jgi:hypothetical protein
MTAAVNSIAIGETSPSTKARITGVLYLVTIALGIYAQAFVSDRLFVSGNAAATANAILTHESLYRLGTAAFLIEMSCQIAMTVLFYDLLKPVSRGLSLLAAVFGLVGCVVKTTGRLFFGVPLLIFGGGSYLSVFNADQLKALSLLFLNINEHGATTAWIFFGIYAVLKGYLIVRSTFLPRILGVLGILAGLGWLSFLSRPLGDRMFPYVALVGLLGALAQIAWLIVFGVHDRRWKEQARVAAASIWR